MPPTVMSAPVHPAGKRVGSMLMRLARTLVPSVRASPAAGKAARLGVLASNEGELRIAGEAHALAARAAVTIGGGVAVVARQRVVEVPAAYGGRGAEVRGAHVRVVAGVWHADAGTAEAGISHRADVAVVASRRPSWRWHASRSARPGSCRGRRAEDSDSA